MLHTSAYPDDRYLILHTVHNEPFLHRIPMRLQLCLMRFYIIFRVKRTATRYDQYVNRIFK